MSNITTEQVVIQEPIRGIPEEIIAKNRAKFHAFVEFLGGVIREEGRGFRATCPACNRDTLHVRPTPNNRIAIRCHYCGGSAPRRVLRENGFDIPAPGPVVIDHAEIKQTWDRWRSQGAAGRHAAAGARRSVVTGRSTRWRSRQSRSSWRSSTCR